MSSSDENLCTEQLITDSQWDDFWTGMKRPPWPEYTAIRIRWFREMCKHISLSYQLPDPFIVEVGAGAGWVTKAIVPLYRRCRYICADISKTALDEIDRLQLTNVETRYMSEISGLGRIADLVICGDVLEHVCNRGAFLAQIASVIKPHGHLLLSTPNRFVPILYLRRLLGKEATGQPFDRPVDREQLVYMLRTYGFEPKTCAMTSASRRPVLTSRSALRSFLLDKALKMVKIYLNLWKRPTEDAILLWAEYVGASKDGS